MSTLFDVSPDAGTARLGQLVDIDLCDELRVLKPYSALTSCIAERWT